MIHQKAHKLLVYLALVMAAQACAPLQPPSVGGPRANEAPYPVLLAEDNHRRETATAAVNHLMRSEVATVTTPPLQPVTATIESLPANTSPNVYLPKVGANPVMNEEETREALRRFIRDWQGPIGAEPAKLSLVDRVDQPDGSKIARYEQRAFRYPTRGNYGKLEIRFTPERRVLNIMSTCIPDADKLQAALAAVPVKLKAEDAMTALIANEIQYSDAGGTKLNFRPTANNKLEPHELVTYITPAATQPNGLEFHVAWEISVGGAPFQIAYVDAVTGQVVGTRQGGR
ncbi:MAG: hypothetical protein ACR2H4_10510 [Pyrinomonadaceae bacterium]